MRVSPLSYTRYTATKLLARVRHSARIHFPLSPSIVFIGGYHGENTGDWAMGEALLEEANQRGIVARRLAMRDAARLLELSASVVVGGGAVATADALAPVAAAWSVARFPVTLVGVDFGANLYEFDPTVREMCQAATSIGLRHKNQLGRVREWSRNPNSYAHADIAFARQQQSPCQRDPNLVVLNMLPVFHFLDGSTFKPGSFLESEYRKHKSSLADKASSIGQGYVEFVTKSVDRLIADGYSVVHLPFAPEDDAFARTVLPRKCNFFPFTTDFARLERIIASAAFLLPTRFHALIAGFRTLTPIVPIAYAAKVQELLAEFGIDRDAVIDRLALAAGCPSLSIETVTQKFLAAATQSAVGAVNRAITEASSARS